MGIACSSIKYTLQGRLSLQDIWNFKALGQYFLYYANQS